MTSPQPRRSWIEQIMGLPISLLARGPAAGSDAAAAAVAAVYAELREVDATFSTYRFDSPISRLARGDLTLADCPAVVRDVAARCDAATKDTDGLFNAVRPSGGWDPSGLVKGWAGERALRLLQTVAEVDWCLNAGGDVAVWCPSGVGFTVGIHDPQDPTRVAAAVLCQTGGVATSGTAARGQHLYDPRTGDPAVAALSVSVVGASLERADLLATAAFVAAEGALEFIAGFPGFEALRIDLAGAITTTAGWPGR